MSLSKVIIWGYPLHSHTHSYIHYGWHKTFTALGYDTYWFHDNQYPDPRQFDYTNCLFITEGYADSNIPLHESNVYIVHVARYPMKYIAVGARLIDLRYNVRSMYDCNYQYNTMDKESCGKIQRISSASKYEAKASDRDLNQTWWARPSEEITYEALYMYWATDLLPAEINLEHRFINPASPPATVFIGSIGAGNYNEVYKLKGACERHGIQFTHIDPWKNPISFDDNRTLIQSCFITPDVRGSGELAKTSVGDTGTCHKQNGYVPCRIFKNISYGKFCATNSKAVQDALCLGDSLHIMPCEEDEQKLVELCLKEHNNHDLIKQQMEWVRDNHTYVNRINDIVQVLARKNNNMLLPKQ